VKVQRVRSNCPGNIQPLVRHKPSVVVGVRFGLRLCENTIADGRHTIICRGRRPQQKERFKTDDGDVM
jgi:hypothetical protein